MVTVSHVVNRLIDNKKFLQEAINQGVISNQSLAKKLKPEVESELGQEIKTSAIVMALRRYEEKLESIREPPFDYFLEIGMKTNICYIVVSESASLLPKISTLYRSIDFKRGGILNISHGTYQAGIITNDRYKEKLLDILKTENIVHVIPDIVMISLTYAKDFTFTAGVLYDVVRFVTWENINMLNVLHTPSELFLYVEKKDAVRCYKTLERLLKKAEKGQPEK